MSNQNTPRTQSPLALLQARFSLFSAAGSFYVIDEDEVAAIKNGTRRMGLGYMKRPDAELALTRFLESQPVPSDVKETIKQFWRNPNTKVYTGVAFHPIEKDPNILNLWVPSPVVPRKGDFSAIRAFLFDVICGSNKETYHYVFRYLAHMLQKPEEKPGIAIVLMGGQGVGKGMFFQLLRKLWPSTTLQTADVKRVVIGFNVDLERAFVTCLDEALFSGDKGSAERLKSLITEPFIQIEQKYEPQRSIRSIHRFFFATNNDHFAQTDRDDRRMVYIRVSDVKKQDFEYFKSLAAAFKDPHVLSAFVYDLLKEDLQSFNVRKRPLTSEHAIQKIKSLSGFERYWFEVLIAGDLGGTSPKTMGLYSQSEVWSEGRFIGTSMLLDLVRHADPQLSRYGILQEASVNAFIKKLCPAALPKRRNVSTGVGGKAPQRGFDLPDLAQAREDFLQYLGISFDWETGTPKLIGPNSQSPNDAGEVLVPVANQDQSESGGVATFTTLTTPFKKKENLYKESFFETPGNGGRDGNFTPPQTSRANIFIEEHVNTVGSVRLPETEDGLRTFLNGSGVTCDLWCLEYQRMGMSEKISDYRAQSARISAALQTLSEDWRPPEEHWVFQGVDCKTREAYLRAVTPYLSAVLIELDNELIPKILRISHFAMFRLGYCHHLAFQQSLKTWRWFVPDLQVSITSMLRDPLREIEYARGKETRRNLFGLIDMAFMAAFNMDCMIDRPDEDFIEQELYTCSYLMGCQFGVFHDEPCIGLVKNGYLGR
jgi:hypothetical protein